VRGRHPDLMAAAVAAVVCAGVVLFVQFGPLRFLAAIGLALVLPAYTLTAAAFARRDIEGSVRLLVGVMAAVATLAVGAVALHVTGLGMTKATWTVLLLGVVLVACRSAMRRRWTPPTWGVELRLPEVGLAHGVLLLAAGIAVAAGIALSGTPLPAANVLGYTQLWMLPEGTATQPEVRLGVRSSENEARAYRLELRIGDVTRIVRARFVLRPGRALVQRVRLPRLPELSGTRRSVAGELDKTRVTALLYRLDRPEPYRRVTAHLLSQ
jgi:hypothetical protein